MDVITIYKKEIERYLQVLDIKQEIVEKVQSIMRTDLHYAGKLINSLDVRV